MSVVEMNKPLFLLSMMKSQTAKRKKWSTYALAGRYVVKRVQVEMNSCVQVEMGVILGNI